MLPGSKAERALFMGASLDRLRFRLPDPEPSPVGLANAGSPLQRGRRFFLGLGEEGGGSIYSTGSQLDVGPQRRAASPKPQIPIGDSILTSLPKIQARTSVLEVRGLLPLVAQTQRRMSYDYGPGKKCPRRLNRKKHSNTILTARTLPGAA